MVAWQVYGRKPSGANMIRVLHLFGRMARGGAELRTIEVMPKLRQYGVEFHFCALSGQQAELDEYLREQGSEVYYCPISPRLGFGRRFGELLKNQRFDIVHSHVYYSSGLTLRVADHCGIPGRIMHFRSMFDNQYKSIIRTAYRMYAKRLGDKHANAILAVSNAAMASAWGVNWQRDPRTRVIYNGLDATRFTELPRTQQWLRDECKIPDNHKIILQVGNFRFPKGHDLSIAATAELIKRAPNTHLVLVGDGELRGQIESDIDRTDIRDHVTLLGSRDDVPRLFRAADCALLPSHWEGLPGVALESVAAGTPIIATDLDCVREVSDHTGLVIPVNRNPAAFADAIVEVLARPHRCNSSAFPEIFSLDRCAEQFASIYQNLVS